ncbi:hypothetical protein A3K73_02685 [Candidatus Pacearchaeota archaeon RBG_13_36_9]|nr:MAG: hypothetical protein A3K73_02685 [Candidatus Pacearchaeota archaeon RBG_13_36_9]
MIKTIIGVIVLLIPFLLLYKFKDKKEGFCTILAFLLIFHLAVAVLTQLFGIFNYLVILFVCAVADIFILAKISYKELKAQLKKIKIDIVLVAAIVIVFLCLYQVHSNYTGTVTSATAGFSEVENIKYPYPYFSDEWSAVSFIKYSISSGKLPLVNPLWYNSPFNNLELPFHSFVSEIILVLDLDPLTQFALLHIFTGMIICVLVYFILRANGISKLASSVPPLSLLYIVNGANLPGIWTLIPLILGIISMLLGLFFMSVNNRKMIFLTAFLTLIFYPPLFVLHLPAILVSTLFSNQTKKQKVKSVLLYFCICILAAVLLAVIWLRITGSFSTTFSNIGGRIFYSTLTKDAIPDFSIWKVIPIPVLILALPALLKIKKKKYFLIAPIILGLVYWFIYSKVLWRVIIEYERVVVSTSILIVLFSGFGVQYIIDYVRKNHHVSRSVFVIAQIIILIFFFIISFSYTERGSWQELKLYPLKGGVVLPASPANIYLNEQDLTLFSKIKGKNFISLPWKGTVIGVSTDNYPLDTKPATITNSILSYSFFIFQNCAKKSELAKQYQISYVYSREFDCRDFKEIAISEEDLHLYEFIG